jgi:cytochrome P450
MIPSIHTMGFKARPEFDEPHKRILPGEVPFSSIIQTYLFWRWPYAFLEKCRQFYGTRFTVSPVGPVGTTPLVFLADPEEIRQIIMAPANVLHPGAGAAVISPLVGEHSFMLAEEQDHMSGRKAITPAFRHALIHQHKKMVHEIVQSEIAAWPLDRPFAVHPYLRALTLRVILRTMFHEETLRTGELHRRLLAMLEVTGSLALQEEQLRGLPGWRGLWQKFLTERSKVDELLYEAISDASHGDGLLGRLLDAVNPDGSVMSSQQVRDTLLSIILAGHETTAAELAWALQLLAYHRNVRERLVRELDLDSEGYLVATVQEVLRHRPVFLFTIPRKVNTPIEIGGWIYRSPVHLLGCIYLMHHDPVHYPQPDEFRPERFLDAEPDGRLWRPWGGGRKRCPGHHLATLELQIVLRVVLTELELAPACKHLESPRWRSVIVTPRYGSRITLSHRSRRPAKIAHSLSR